MKWSSISTVLAIAANLSFATGSDPAPWEVRSYLGEPSRVCEDTRVELVLRSSYGEVTGRHEVVFVEGLQQDTWLPTAVPGAIALEVYRVDCDGVRAKVGELKTKMATSTRAKEVFIAAEVRDARLEPSFVEIDTYSAAGGRLLARRDGDTLVFSNPGPTDVELCGRSSVTSVRDEYLANGEWIPSAFSLNWHVPQEVTSIASGGELALRPQIIVMEVPPDSATPTAPDGARVILAIKPKGINYLKLDTSATYGGFPGCDFLYVAREVTAADQIWPRDHGKP